MVSIATRFNRVSATLLWLCAVLGAFLLASPAARGAPFAYITNATSNTVSVIDTASDTVTATVPVGNGPTGVAINPAGTRVYVANLLSSNVSVLNTATNTVIATVALPNGPTGLAINPAGTRLYVGNNDAVSVIDTVSVFTMPRIATSTATAICTEVRPNH